MLHEIIKTFEICDSIYREGITVNIIVSFQKMKNSVWLSPLLNLFFGSSLRTMKENKCSCLVSCPEWFWCCKCLWKYHFTVIQTSTCVDRIYLLLLRSRLQFHVILWFLWVYIFIYGTIRHYLFIGSVT